MRATRPVAITPLVIEQLPITRRGLTAFTYTRFLVPWLCDFEGSALYLDIDMLALADIAELFDLMDDSAVMVSKNRLRYEWASVMLFNCATGLKYPMPVPQRRLDKGGNIDYAAL